jgi:hypothetical protein
MGRMGAGGGGNVGAYAADDMSRRLNAQGRMYGGGMGM